MSAPAATDVERLARLLRSAVHQRLLMEPWLRDKARQAAGQRGDTLYAVDTDITVFYSDPARAGSGKDGLAVYAQIFADDASATSRTIGHALGDYIFFRLTGADKPLILLPPMDQEFRSVHSAVRSKATADAANALINAFDLQNIFQSIEESGSNGAQEFVRRAHEIVKVLKSRTGPASELIAFNRLLSNQRLMTPEIWLGSTTVDTKIARAFDEPAGIADMWRFNNLADKWLQTLKSINPSKKRHQVVTDAAVLARVEWINERLSSTSTKLIYITGDEHILQAGLEEGSGGTTFTDRYLRHPKMLLGEERLYSVPLTDYNDLAFNSDDTLVSWLDAFIAKDDSIINSRARRLSFTSNTEADSITSAAALLRLSPAISSEFETTWHRFAERIAAPYARAVVEQDNVRVNTAALIAEVARLGKSISDVWDDVLAEITEAWDATFRVAISAGVGQIVGGAQRLPRSPPAWSLDQFQDTAEQFLDLIFKNDGTQLPDAGAAALIKQLRDKDNSGYVYFLSHSLLFAVYGHWHLSAVVARVSEHLARAYRTADPAKANHASLTGREAAYIHAVASRHSAKSLQDLDAARASLGRARVYLEEDLSVLGNEGKIIPPNLGHPYRFDAEALALEYTQYLLNRFSGNQNYDDSEINRSKLKTVIGRCAGLLDQLADEPDDLVRWRIERQLLCHLWVLVALEKSDKVFVFDATKYARFNGVLARNIKSDHVASSPPSVFVELAAALEGWVASDAQHAHRAAARKLIAKMLSPKNRPTIQLMTYDPKLYDFFLLQVGG
jgi:hypothetical protein